MLFYQAMKDAMSIKEITLTDLSEISNIDYFTLYQYYTGVDPTYEIKHKICGILDINENDIEENDMNISVNEASKLMKKSPNFVKKMVVNGVFGFTDGKSFHIPRHQFMKYMGLEEDVHLESVLNQMIYLMMEKNNLEKKKLKVGK